ncbi:F-box only protein 33 [Aplysia californica]|uniref:F-box only protein 33 n=1 Tax=Aplysia californica TaxID=6500 RepID=A0ABM0ZW12_APLCA|nr:F-box only protein 33 [Aplysia californica]
MAAGGDWASLPSVVLEEIFSMLLPKDRINASSSCRRWREYLFLPQFWTVISFNLNYRGRLRTKFLSSKCAKFAKEATVEFNSTRGSQVWDCSRLLELLSRNRHLECISLRPSNCYFDGGSESLQSFLESLQLLIKRNKRLLHLSLGCTEILLHNSQELFNLLVKYHAPYLQSLHLATVKEDTSSYDVPYIGIDNFAAFANLRALSIDYDFVTPKFLAVLAHRDRGAPPLHSLCLHIHRVNQRQPTDSMWKEVLSANLNMELTLNLVHSVDGLQALLDVLKPSMPLTHYRQYFCGDVNVASLNMMSSLYYSTLSSLTIVEAINHQPINYTVNDTEDPFVMLAWRCTRLQSLKLIGMSLDQKDLVAIARLRSGLQQLTVPSCCVFWNEEDEDYYDEDDALVDLEYKISESLGRPWQPLSEFLIPPAVFYHDADADSAYMPELLKDQEWQRKS